MMFLGWRWDDKLEGHVECLRFRKNIWVGIEYWVRLWCQRRSILFFHERFRRRLCIGRRHLVVWFFLGVGSRRVGGRCSWYEGKRIMHIIFHFLSENGL